MIINRKLGLTFFLISTVLFSMACALIGVNSSAPSGEATVISMVTQAALATGTSAPATPTTATVTVAPATDTPAPATQAAPALSSDDAIKAAQAAWAKLATAGPRHISQNSYKGDTIITNIEADSVPPNLHQVTTVMGNVIAEQYFFDGAIYNKINGAWSHLPGAAPSAINAIEGFAQGMASGLVYAEGKVLGVEAVNGKPATMYYYTTTLTGLKANPAQYTIWVDNATGLPVKRVNINPEGMKIVQLITYDPNIKLTLPDEAKNSPLAK
jgi:hypothetical protein